MYGVPAGAKSYRPSQRRKLALSAKENESVEDAFERRLKESEKVEERVEVVFSEQEVQQALDEVGINFHVTFLPSNPSHRALLERSAVSRAEVSLSCVTHIIRAESVQPDWPERPQASQRLRSNFANDATHV